MTTKIKSLVNAVIAAQGRVGERVAALADGIHAEFEPASVAEVCRAVYGDEFKVSRKPESDAEKLDKSRYEAVRYAIGRLIADGRWPDNRKPRKPRTPKGDKGGKGKPDAKGKGKGKPDAAAATAAIKPGDTGELLGFLKAHGWTRRHLDALAQTIMAAE